jgi:phosphorylcholine metabolism protein LicD
MVNRPVLLSDNHIISMIRRTKRIIKPKLIKLLHIFIIWAENNNLDWFLDYGSLLGAIRDNGFIPYDDDIDITVQNKINTLVGDSITITINDTIIKIVKHSWDLNHINTFYRFTNEDLGMIDLFTPNYVLPRAIDIYKNNLKLIIDSDISIDPPFYTKLIMFEKVQVKIPVNYDSILKLRYGDDYNSVYYVTNHQYTDYGFLEEYKNNLRKLTRRYIYILIRKAG